MYILGINAYHGDSSACLLKDGVLLSAAEEERFRRLKHWAGFPSESISWCLRDAGISISDIDHIAINQNASSNLIHKILFLVKNKLNVNFLRDRLKNKKQRFNIKLDLNKLSSVNTRYKLHYIDHHRSHLASAYSVSGFDNAAILSIDGFGDFASTVTAIGKGQNITILNKVLFPHSMGIFYQALTQWLGFNNYGDEYKVMGLAPYGEPKYVDILQKIVALKNDGTFELDLKFFAHHNGSVKFEWTDGEPKIGTLYTPALVELLGASRRSDEQLTQYHMDIAKSIQAVYESTLFHVLNMLHKNGNTDNLCLAGGCAMNSVANGKIYNNTPFKKIYVQSAAGDAGGAIGAAYVAWGSISGKTGLPMEHSYWGPKFSDSEIGQLIESRRDEISSLNCVVTQYEDFQKLCSNVAESISDGNVIGWFQDRMEWGPRALGNRSILGDPRRSNMKDILNLKIKRRESFRPFAPSILREEVAEWFENDEDVPFMMQVFKIKENKRSMIPAVTHVDGSGRLQTVTNSSNKKYYELIKTFYQTTGIPMLLNTSFNENEPVVCTPQEALNCFIRTKMDKLVMGNWVITRKSNEAIV